MLIRHTWIYIAGFVSAVSVNMSAHSVIRLLSVLVLLSYGKFKFWLSKENNFSYHLHRILIILRQFSCFIPASLRRHFWVQTMRAPSPNGVHGEGWYPGLWFWRTTLPKQVLQQGSRPVGACCLVPSTCPLQQNTM